MKKGAGGVTFRADRHRDSGVRALDEESKWIERSRGGSAEAFGHLVLLHQGRIRAYVGQYFRNPDLVDDLAQEVFLTAYRDFGTYKEDLPLAPWLLGIARNRVLNALRA